MSIPAPLEFRAWENLDAARTLLALDEPCPNASTSRAYYAAYLATWSRLVREGHTVPERAGGRYFAHKELPDDAQQAGVLDGEQADKLEFLESLRVSADYFEIGVDVEAAAQGVDFAASLVEHLLGEP